MHTNLVITIMGNDKPGIVDLLSRTLHKHNANWLESRMAGLAGQFAGIVLVSMPDQSAVAATAELKELAASGQLDIAIHETGNSPAGDQTHSLDLAGRDRNGIIRQITQALLSRKINILELTTDFREARSLPGDALFHAIARIAVPDNVSVSELTVELDELANELMIDIILIN